jgi:FkbM family methyltransferase
MKKIIITVLLCMQLVHAEYYSQVGQDKFVNEHYFKNMRNGTFVEIGAYNGVCFSNSYFFEKELDWRGLCIEPVPRVFADLQKSRTCTCIQAAMAGTEGVMQFVDIEKLEELSGLKKFFDEEPHRWHVVNLYLASTPGSSYKIIDIPVITFNKTMDEHGITRVDYLSIDTEGSELDIIKSIDFDRIAIYVISVENNENTHDVRDILESKGFTFVTKFNGFDDLYVNHAHAPHHMSEA